MHRYLCRNCGRISYSAAKAKHLINPCSCDHPDLAEAPGIEVIADGSHAIILGDEFLEDSDHDILDEVALTLRARAAGREDRHETP